MFVLLSGGVWRTFFSNIVHQLSLFFKPELSNVKPNERNAEQRIKVYFQLLFSASPTTTTTRQISNKFPLNIKTPPVVVVDIFITFQESFCIRYYLIATASLSLSKWDPSHSTENSLGGRCHPATPVQSLTKLSHS